MARSCFLVKKSGDFNKAAKVIMEHPEDSYDDISFREVIGEVTISEVYYDAIKFYIEFNPSELKNILLFLSPKLDPAKVVTKVRRLNHLPLIKEYLVSVQEKNLNLVTEALHELYIEEENFEALKNSIDKFDNFDSNALAIKLKKNDLVEFKKIAAYLFEKNNRFQESIDICKDYKLYKQAIETAAESGSNDVANHLLEYFIEIKKPDCFASCLYACYDLVKPDVVLFLAWRNGYMEYIMPYLAQVLREYTDKIDLLVETQSSQQVPFEDIPSQNMNQNMSGIPPNMIPPNMNPNNQFNPGFGNYSFN